MNFNPDKITGKIIVDDFQFYKDIYDGKTSSGMACNIEDDLDGALVEAEMFIYNSKRETIAYIDAYSNLVIPKTKNKPFSKEEKVFLMKAYILKIIDSFYIRCQEHLGDNTPKIDVPSDAMIELLLFPPEQNDDEILN
jgi:hypothetical protein